MMKRCCPTGSPSSCCFDGRAKRKMRVSCETEVFSRAESHPLVLDEGRRVGRRGDVGHRNLLVAGGAALEVADVVLLQNLPRLARVECLKLLSTVLASREKDRRRAARVIVQVLGRVVDLALDDDPESSLVSCLLDLRHRELLAVAAYRWLGAGAAGALSASSLLLEPAAEVAGPAEGRGAGT